MSEDITNEFWGKVSRPLRPERVSDKEYDATYHLLLNSIKAEKNGEVGTVVSRAELKRRLVGEN